MEYVPGVVNKFDWYWWLVSFGVVISTRAGVVREPIGGSLD